MPFAIAAVLAVTAAAAPEGTSVESNLEYAKPIAGKWTYAPAVGGSEAVFDDASGHPQLTIRCTRATRRITIAKPAPSASPTLWVWTSSQSRSVPASFDAKTGRVRAELAGTDALLDAMASSRGRIGFSTSGLAALIVPPWGEVGRVIEDCRV